MAKKQKMTSRLRELLARPGMVVAPGCYDALTARIIERTGFDAAYASGAYIAWSIGLPDQGMTTLTEVVQRATYIADSVNIPVIIDGDTGFGHPINTQRLIRELERAGIAGVHIEDQEVPKRCGHLAGKRLVPLEEHATRIRAASDARSDPDFVIVARIDAIAVEGFDRAIERAKAYVEAGADMVFFDGIETVEQLREAVKRLPDTMHFVHPSEGGKTPFLSAQEFEALGYKTAIYIPGNIRAGFKMMIRVLQELKEKGTTAALSDLIPTLPEQFEWNLGGDREVMDLINKYSVEQRDDAFWWRKQQS